MVTTAERLDFSLTKGYGSAVGARYDSQSGYLALEQAVEITTYRGSDKVQVHAQHAELDRGAQICLLRAAQLTTGAGRQARPRPGIVPYRWHRAAARRVRRLHAGHHAAAIWRRLRHGWNLTNTTSRARGRCEGGVTMDSAHAGWTAHGTSPVAQLEFTAQGELKQANLERGVQFESEQSGRANAGQAEALRVTRTWTSPTAQLKFDDAGKGQVELQSLHGTGGVMVTSETQHGSAAAVPSKMSADEVMGTFAQRSVLRELIGTGHATITQATATGARQIATGDRLEARFSEGGIQGTTRPSDLGTKAAREQGSKRSSGRDASGTVVSRTADLQSAELDGHVVLHEQPAAKSGASSDGSSG